MALDGSITPATLCAWLRGLAAFITMPPVRPYDSLMHHYLCAMPNVVAHRRDPRKARAPSLAVNCCHAAARRWQGAAPRRSRARDARLRHRAAATRAAQLVASSHRCHRHLGLWVLGLESDALAAASSACLPRALLAPGLAAAEVAGTGGELVLFELELQGRQMPTFFGTDSLAQSHKLVLVLVNSCERQARHPNGELEPSPFSMVAPKMAKFGDVVRGRGIPSSGGVQFVSSACWVQDPGANETDCWMAYGPHTVRFWIREARLQEMIAGDGHWHAYAAVADSWQVINHSSAELRAGRIVRRLDGEPVDAAE
jgi:hypothetical protein